MVLSRATWADLNFKRISQATVLRTDHRAARAEAGKPVKKLLLMFRLEMMMTDRLRRKQQKEKSG